mgnify:CR=1 FL=1
MNTSTRKTYTREQFEEYGKTLTFNAMTKFDGKAEQLKLDMLYNGVSEEMAELISVAIKKPNELLYIKHEANYNKVDFALASMKGLSFVIGSKTDDKRYEEELEREAKAKEVNAEYTAYMETDQYFISELLNKMLPEKRAELQALAYLIGRSINGQSVNNIAKEF